MNGTALTTLVDSATGEYELQNDFCGLAMLSDILYPQVRYEYVVVVSQVQFVLYALYVRHVCCVLS